MHFYLGGPLTIVELIDEEKNNNNNNNNNSSNNLQVKLSKQY